MSLTNCSQCQYFNSNPHHPNDLRCAIAPHYAQMYLRLDVIIHSDSLPIDACHDFKFNEEFAPVEIPIQLTKQQWQQLATQSQIAELIEQIRPHVNLTLQWIAVNSSCIDAITYNFNNWELQIRFVSGLVYKYYQIEPLLYEQFCTAHSKGQFFNQRIKDRYNYSLVCRN